MISPPQGQKNWGWPPLPWPFPSALMCLRHAAHFWPLSKLPIMLGLFSALTMYRTLCDVYRSPPLESFPPTLLQDPLVDYGKTQAPRSCWLSRPLWVRSCHSRRHRQSFSSFFPFMFLFFSWRISPLLQVPFVEIKGNDPLRWWPVFDPHLSNQICYRPRWPRSYVRRQTHPYSASSRH